MRKLTYITHHPYYLHYIHYFDSLRLQNKKNKNYDYSVFNKYKCIFIHIPKNGGVSVTENLFGNLAGGHTTAKQYQRIFGSYKFNRYFKFTVIRNPEERVKSAYNFLKNGGFDKRDEDWSNKYLRKYNSLDSYILNGLDNKVLSSKYHFMPQVYFLKTHSGKICVDRFIDIKELDYEIELIANKLGINYSPKEKLNRSKITDDYISYESKNKIKKLYAEDYKLLNLV